MDTFGVHAQEPQILRGFGLDHLLANRFGGSHVHDLFRARGLDGTEISVAGWGTYAGRVRRENVSCEFCQNWDDIERCFASTDLLTGPGPASSFPTPKMKCWSATARTNSSPSASARAALADRDAARIFRR